ncbi:MAG: hypothetical protein KF760_19030 [Candidatus Eremiobacteraeota bacterium]|nr:hypothetical protein [Candidatus Eremiobacteraeota bacterium]MCW5870287.1 hypothetical protein [Candidatus Eremiobacteraeota bacterium]
MENCVNHKSAGQSRLRQKPRASMSCNIPINEPRRNACGAERLPSPEQPLAGMELNSFAEPGVARRMPEDDFPIGVPGLEEPRPKGTSCLLLLAHPLVFTGGFFAALILLPNFLPPRAQGQLTACKSNCKNLATALEMYASDHQGLYPGNLDRLIAGNYLKVIPTCPSVSRVTYTDYRVSPKQTYFHFSCVGNNHARAYTGFASKSSDDLPAYSSEKGLVDHP